MSHQPPVQWEVNLIALVNTVQLQHTVLEITNVKTEVTRQKMKREKAKKGERGKSITNIIYLGHMLNSKFTAR